MSHICRCTVRAFVPVPHVRPHGKPEDYERCLDEMLDAGLRVTPGLIALIKDVCKGRCVCQTILHGWEGAGRGEGNDRLAGLGWGIGRGSRAARSAMLVMLSLIAHPPLPMGPCTIGSQLRGRHTTPQCVVHSTEMASEHVAHHNTAQHKTPPCLSGTYRHIHALCPHLLLMPKPDAFLTGRALAGWCPTFSQLLLENAQGPGPAPLSLQAPMRQHHTETLSPAAPQKAPPLLCPPAATSSAQQQQQQHPGAKCGGSVAAKAQGPSFAAALAAAFSKATVTSDPPASGGKKAESSGFVASNGKLGPAGGSGMATGAGGVGSGDSSSACTKKAHAGLGAQGTAGADMYRKAASPSSGAAAAPAPSKPVAAPAAAPARKPAAAVTPAPDAPFASVSGSVAATRAAPLGAAPSSSSSTAAAAVAPSAAATASTSRERGGSAAGHHCWTCGATGVKLRKCERCRTARYWCVCVILVACVIAGLVCVWNRERRKGAGRHVHAR